MVNYQFKKIILFIILLFLFACKKENNSDVIARSEFIEMLTDLSVYESIMTDKGWYDGGVLDSSKSYYNFIFKKYNITRSKFDYSLTYYSRNLDDLLNIYNEVNIQLNNRIPKQLNSKSIYNIIVKTIDEAAMRVDPVKRFGEGGIELWLQKNFLNFPGDPLKPEIGIQKEIKHQCLVVLKADYMIMPNDMSKNMKMNLIIFYKDSTSDTIQSKLIIKNGKWENYHLCLKTNTKKEPIGVRSTVFTADSINEKTFVSIRDISLRQYAPAKDTTKLFPKKEPVLIESLKAKKGIKVVDEK